MPKEKSITVNKLRTEANRERWDPPRAKKGVRVKARNDQGQMFEVTGICKDRHELVLAIEMIDDEESHGS